MNSTKYNPNKQAPLWSDKKAWSAWFKSFVEYHKKNKRPNSYNRISPVIIELIKENEKGIKYNLLFKSVKQKLTTVSTNSISIVIKKMIKLGILEKILRKGIRHLIKGHYWNSHTR